MTLPTLTDMLIEAHEKHIIVRLDVLRGAGFSIFIGDKCCDYAMFHLAEGSFNDICHALHRYLMENK